jgi:MFS family permease
MEAHCSGVGQPEFYLIVLVRLYFLRHMLANAHLPAIQHLSGSLNVMIPYTFIAGILTYAWPFTRSTASLIVVTLIYGFCCGSYVALLTNPIMSLGREGDVGRRVGMYLTIMAIGALAGPPISGAINTRTDGFEAVGIYAGKLPHYIL